jgi:hypothetical protein
LAKIRAAFLNKAERSIHGVAIAHNPENSDTWDHSVLDPANNLFRLLPERFSRRFLFDCIPQSASAFGNRFAAPFISDSGLCGWPANA